MEAMGDEKSSKGLAYPGSGPCKVHPQQIGYPPETLGECLDE
jgi:hypothetical protein